MDTFSNTDSFWRYFRRFSLPLTLVLLSACGSGSDSDPSMISNDTPVTETDVLFVEARVPDYLNNANINNLNAQLRYGGTTFELQDGGHRFTANLNIGIRDPGVSWQLQFYEIFQGAKLPLSVANGASLLVTADTLIIEAEQFSAASLDADNDGDSNLDERNARSEPFNANNTTTNSDFASQTTAATLNIDVDIRELVNLPSDNLGINVIVADQELRLTPRAEYRFSGSINFTAVPTTQTSIQFEVTAQATDVIVDSDKLISLEPGDNLLELQASDFNTGLDNDFDGLTNIQEIEATQITPFDLMVSDITRIPSQDAPFIDGIFNTDTVWSRIMQSSPSSTRSLEQNWIDKLLKTTPTNTYPSGQATHEWTAVHDGERIYFAIRVIDEAILTDSGGQFWQDDSVEVYIDGDNSRRPQYDGINDFQFILNPTGNNSGVLAPGANSRGLPAGIEYAVSSNGFDLDIGNGWSDASANIPTVSTGYNVELSIPINQIGARVDGIIGLDVHINDDDDGGIRDAKWNWAWPRQADNHWQNPTLFGAARLR